MKIERLKVNHISNPVGFALGCPVLSWVVSESSGKNQKAARIRVAEDAAMERILFDSGMREDISALGFALPCELRPATRYWWDVTVEADDGDLGVSEPAWFETPVLMQKLTGDMIGCEAELNVCEFFKTVALTQPVRRARAYVTSLGIFELRINGHRVGNEYLTPYCNDYDSWHQVITFDVTDDLKQGENVISAVVAPGWYSGYFGFEGKNKIYGDELGLFLNLCMECEDGSVQVISTDDRFSELM